MEELKLKVEEFIREKYGIDEIEYESKEYFNYAYILDVLYRYCIYNHKHSIEIMPIVDRLIEEADKFLELK